MKKLKYRIVYNAPAVLTFALLSFAVLLLGQLTNNQSTYRFFMVYRGSPTDPLTYLRLVSHVFGHTDFSHFSGNFLYILMLGPGVEEKYGTKRLVGMMAVTALITGVMQVALFPSTGLLGASGIVYMMIVLSSATNFKKGEIPLTLVVVAALYIGSEFVSGMALADNVSHFAHIVGGLCGGAFGLALAGQGSRRHR